MADSKRAVYYTTDNNPSCILRLRWSIRSLREFNQTIPVYVAYFGPLYEDDRRFFEEQHVSLIYNPEKINPYLARFFVLENDFPESELAYLDTDTHIFRDIEELFDKTGPEDFHAREAPRTQRDGYPVRGGLTMYYKSIVNYEVFDYICKNLNIQPLPFFNIGLLVFKNNFHIRLRSYLEHWTLLIRMFESKQLPYPCQFAHVSRETVTPMVLAGIPQFSWSYIDRNLAPFYNEYRCDRLLDTGVLIHTFRSYYPAFLLDFVGKEETLEYLSVARNDPPNNWRWWLVNTMLPIGGSVRYRSVFLRRLVHAWIKTGAWLYRSHIKKLAKVQSKKDQLSTHAAAANRVK